MDTRFSPDAVLAPLNYAGVGEAMAKLEKLQAEFSVVLNVSRVYVRHQGTSHFISGCYDDTLDHTSRGQRSGEPRYRWADRGDGVSYGYLRLDANEVSC